MAAAVAFLTRIPVSRAIGAEDVRRAGSLFPAVGALIGSLQAIVVFAAGEILPALPLAACAVTLGVAVTGALHLDGLADVADGVGGGRTREDALRIMRDPAVGTFGVVSIVLVLVMKVTVVAALIELRTATAALIAAPTLGRWAIVALGHALPYARPQGGLGLAAGRFSRAQLAGASAIVLFIGLSSSGWSFLLAWASVIGVTIAMGAFAMRHLGGFTGDVLGAASEVVEAVVLLLWVGWLL